MSKAKNVKQHTKTNQQHMEVEDEWGDKGYLVEGIIYKTKEEAKAAIQKLLDDEFKSRYVKEKN